MAELTARVRTFRLKVSENYDERELENLLELFEDRGADYAYLDPVSKPGWYSLVVPWELDLRPFLLTAEECPSVERVERVAVYTCTPEL